MRPVEVRRQIVNRLSKDLIGPDSPNETIYRSRPSDVYLTGILWPMGDRFGSEDDDGSNGDDEDDQNASTPGVTDQQRPCTMGISFATEAEGGRHAVTAEIVFATYSPIESKSATGRKLVHWKRNQHRFNIDDIELPFDSVAPIIKLSKPDLDAEVEVHIRGYRAGTQLLSTITIINRSKPAEPDRRLLEMLTLFQVAMTVKPGSGTNIVPRPGGRATDDPDSRSGKLLFRECREYATGHQCSASWVAASAGHRAESISSRWIPEAEVYATSANGHDVFEECVRKSLFSAERLAESSDAELNEILSMLVTSYQAWLRIQEERVPSLDNDLKAIASDNLKDCHAVLNRIARGVKRLKEDANLRLAFRLANTAMSIQHSWKYTKPGDALVWRPFQLGFILLASESVCNPASSERDIFDLLWFPTGGGKTEAYLAIVAILAFYRRLTAEPKDIVLGNAAVMRYTLRLLTAQQFERAAALILACELIQKGGISSALKGMKLDGGQFSIGLWVGGDATPNTFEKALQNRGNRYGATAEQIKTCACCHSVLQWDYDERRQSVKPYCSNDKCLLGPVYGKWPVYTVDDDIYREKPTLIIGTVDKFALLPRKKEAALLFGIDGRRTDLIIQDELHLISGPLGTIAGLYETAFDWLLTSNSCRPKIIGSTATIRRASDQVLALFERRACQFPPSGIDHFDSGFAVKDADRPGRFYLGITTAGRSAKFVLQAVAGSLLQSCGPDYIESPDDRDGYQTLLCYFNSLRELGGAIVQMLDDVPDSIGLYARRRCEELRGANNQQELTSRVSQKEIVDILSDLSRTASEPGCIDVVLATNMVSVGVDVSRLGLLAVNGQPKTRSEYIQATSRVGRAEFPGLVINILNAAKPRDRSHYETFPSWHATLYRDVEATSVTPYASRSRDRALHAVLVTMLRYGVAALIDTPDLGLATDDDIGRIVAEIERRVGTIDSKELAATRDEIDRRLQEWEARRPSQYLNDHAVAKSLLQSAERYALRKEAGFLPGAAWPTMNNMRSVEPSTRFRMTEVLSALAPRGSRTSAGSGSTGPDGTGPVPPRWRRKNG